MRDLPDDSDDLAKSVNVGEDFARLHEAQSPMLPVVVCSECRSAFVARFRRHRDPEEDSVPKPRIVETPGTLSGRPRIKRNSHRR